MRNGVEEEKEWRRWRFLFVDQKICYILMVVLCSSDLLPLPF
jgi:hypothetical protein